MTHPLGQFKDNAHYTQFRIYYEDTDAAGVVYYANYLKFAERARTDALRLMGIDQAQLLEQENIGFVVRRVEADYKAPARLDDLVTVETTLHSMKRARFTMAQRIKKDDQLLVDMLVEITSVNGDFKPTAPSDGLKETLLSHLPLNT